MAKKIDYIGLYLNAHSLLKNIYSLFSKLYLDNKDNIDLINESLITQNIAEELVEDNKSSIRGENKELFIEHISILYGCLNEFRLLDNIKSLTKDKSLLEMAKKMKNSKYSIFDIVYVDKETGFILLRDLITNKLIDIRDIYLGDKDIDNHYVSGNLLSYKDINLLDNMLLIDKQSAFINMFLNTDNKNNVQSSIIALFSYLYHDEELII